MPFLEERAKRIEISHLLLKTIISVLVVRIVIRLK
jgi:hypothetical protein